MDVSGEQALQITAVGLVLVRRHGGEGQTGLLSTPSGDAVLPQALPADGKTLKQVARELAKEYGAQLVTEPVARSRGGGEDEQSERIILCSALQKRSVAEESLLIWVSYRQLRPWLGDDPLAVAVESCARRVPLPAHLLVDADGCPRSCLRMTETLGHQYRWPVVTVASFHHQIKRSDGGLHVRVSDEPQAADTALANRMRKGDILITQDYGLAALALGKGARALSPHGRVFTPETIDFLLAERHVKASFRRQGGRTSGPPPRRTGDDERFHQALRMLLDESNPSA